MNTPSKLLTSLAVLSFLLSAASPAHAQTHQHEAQTVKVHGTDHAFRGPRAVPAGWTTFEFRNAGAEPHHLQVVRLPDGQSPAAFLQAVKADEARTLGSTHLVGGVGLLLPGQAQQVTLDLRTPGTYMQLCFVRGKDGVPHLALGMSSSLTVLSAAHHDQPPQADVRVKLMDFGFDLPEVIRAGTQLWEVTNDGPEPHEMLMFKLLPGKTLEDVMTYLARPEGDMPAMPVGGAQGVSEGGSMFVRLDLSAGEYFLICALPSPAKGGAPHAALGMLRPFVVTDAQMSR